METLFVDVFRLFLNRDEEYSSLDILPKNIRYSTLSDLLFSARARFRDVCYSEVGSDLNKMEDVVEFIQETYQYNFTGTSFTQTLSPIPPENHAFYIELNDEVYTDYSYDADTNEITINNAPDQSNKVYIGAYVNGKFNQKLNITEMDILADGMEITYIQSKINSESLLDHTIVGRDYSTSGTQANHIKSLKSRLAQAIENFDNRIDGKYSYQQDPNNLSNLGG